jgi:MerR family transcriptional regulator, redox-sensitive transcriptional activator SoxR
MLSIGEVAKRAGTTTSTIRYYERRGLLPVPERRGGKRRYDDDAVGRLQVIKLAQSAGFSLDEVHVLLRATDGHASKTMQRLAKRKLPELRADLERVQALIDLMSGAARCRCPSLERCVELMAKRGLTPNA